VLSQARSHSRRALARSLCRPVLSFAKLQTRQAIGVQSNYVLSGAFLEFNQAVAPSQRQIYLSIGMYIYIYTHTLQNIGDGSGRKAKCAV